MVLRIGDACLHTAGLIGLLVKPHLFDDGTNQALAVRRIVDGELGRKADMGRLGTKNTGKNRMERTHPKESCTLLAHLPGNTLLHFTGSFVSESQCQDIPGIVTVLEQIGYLISEHTRLSGTGTGDDQRRAITVEHRRTLAFIKFFDIVGHKNLSVKSLFTGKDRGKFGQLRTFGPYILLYIQRNEIKRFEFMNTLLMSLIFTTMTYEMPKLPYANNALEPVISQQTIDYHYGKHLQTYVNNLNSLVPGTEYEGKTVEAIVASAPDGAIFNNAGQVLNHTLYFLQFAPKPAKNEPAGKLGEAIKTRLRQL